VIAAISISKVVSPLQGSGRAYSKRSNSNLPGKSSKANSIVSLQRCVVTLQIEHRGAVSTWVPYAIMQRGAILKFAICILKFEMAKPAPFSGSPGQAG
jgi:hypothetical protein